MSTNAPIDLSIIVVNWNSLEVTSAALASIREQVQGVAYEVFVVDNGTTKDDSVRAIPARFPWVRFIANSANLGFTRANNQGVRQATGRYVLLLNNDTIQTENALASAVRYMDERPDVGVLGIMHRNNDAAKSYQPSAFDYPRPWSEVAALLSFSRGQPLPTEPPPEGDVDWVCGSFLMMRRECLGQIGELDERFFIYDEDVDWCLRARKAGWKVRYWPGASMVHLGATSATVMKDKTFTMFRSHLSYIRKHHGPLAAGSFYLAMGTRLVAATAKQAAGFLVGRARAGDVANRWRRQVQFLLLQPGRTGG